MVMAGLETSEDTSRFKTTTIVSYLSLLINILYMKILEKKKFAMRSLYTGTTRRRPVFFLGSI